LYEMKADAARFAALVKERQGMVYSIAWNYLRNQALAEEVAQEAFLELHRRLAQIESDAHAVHFLRRVAVHRAIDEGRRTRLQSRLGLEGVPEPAEKPRRGDPMLEAALGRLVESLPGRARMMVILRYQEDLDPTEIAVILGIPLGTVKSSLHRALNVLRQRMEKKFRGVLQ
jgi:RNA polymerase sigma-70 factor (ECF subfamily)